MNGSQELKNSIVPDAYLFLGGFIILLAPQVNSPVVKSRETGPRVSPRGRRRPETSEQTRDRGHPAPPGIEVTTALFFGSAGGPGSKLPLMGNARPWAGLWECGAFRAVP